MDTRVAVISIIVEQEDAIEELNTCFTSTTVHCRQDGHSVSTEGDQHYQYCH